ncbi:D-tyrosyl-tRNA(Tyr) deacylase [Acinetobacter sp. B5B]|uniref:D-aminoacyl-tRNA deacylase n=1 Tax=Acinetobacter baretiae TaxID=2605383 RepID=UPI0018C1FEF2|nr:D-aminoacyl-tRNA deacylase [Acinetobacter baretiae]MBF7681872.1 D-tyrosyl-tRNA(Tyr) deacylase [Acinetobacter baretiae]
MKALIQRVQQAKVVVDDQTVAKIQQGLLVFIGIAKDDNLDVAKKLLDKVFKYRIFEDDHGKMGWNVHQAQGQVLLVSQFTLMANTQKGLRPDFAPAMPPADAKALYDALIEYAHQTYVGVETGIFGADMKVHLVNDGPVTFHLECHSLAVH